MVTTTTKSTELFEDNAGGLHLVVDGTIYHLPDMTHNGTYADNIADLSWLTEFETENPDGFEPVDDFDFQWVPMIASSDEHGVITLSEENPGGAGRQFLGLTDEED